MPGFLAGINKTKEQEEGICSFERFIQFVYYVIMVVVILNVKSFICVFQICQDFSKCGPFKQLLLQVAESLWDSSSY